MTVTEPQIPTEIDDFETDNRDENTTELHFEIDGKKFTITVDPIDLFKNMIENCFEGREMDDPGSEFGLNTALFDEIHDFMETVKATIKPRVE